MKRLLFISHRVPFPPDKGERTRAFECIKALSAHYRVTLAALLTGGAKERQASHALRRWCSGVILAPAGGWMGLARGAWSMLRGRSLSEGYFHSPPLRRLIAAQCRNGPFDVVIAYSSSTLPFALEVPSGVRVTDLVDVDSAKWSAYAASAGPVAGRLYWAEARAVQALEQQALRRCDAVLLVSDAEAAMLKNRDGKVTVVGNGVDLEYFRPPRTAAACERSVVFTGTMSYRPNVQAVCWFAREVWPMLRACLSGAVFTIVGRDPAAAVRRLARCPGVRVTGSVADVRPYLAGAACVVAPLQIARGIQNKVLEAMAMGCAVVASPAALEGLDVKVGLDVLQAQTPAQYHHDILQLISDGQFRQRLQRAARQRVEERYAWSQRVKPLLSLLERLTGSLQPAEPATTLQPAGTLPQGTEAR